MVRGEGCKLLPFVITGLPDAGLTLYLTMMHDRPTSLAAPSTLTCTMSSSSCRTSGARFNDILVASASRPPIHTTQQIKPAGLDHEQGFRVSRLPVGLVQRLSNALALSTEAL